MRLIGVTGGKGGTGKSTISSALATHLSKKHKVLLVDADVDCPNDHLILNIQRNLEKIVYQRIPEWDFNKCTKCGLCGPVCKSNAIISLPKKKPIFIPEQCNGCGACVIECPVDAIIWTKKEVGKVFWGQKNNLDLLSGELKLNEPVSELIVNALNEKIRKIKNNYEYIIIDTAAGIHCDVINALENCDLVLAVTEATPLGAHDLDLILKLLSQIKVKTKIILNKSNIGEEKIIQKIAKKTKTEIISKISYSQDIILKYAQGQEIKNQNINKIINELN